MSLNPCIKSHAITYALCFIQASNSCLAADDDLYPFFSFT